MDWLWRLYLGLAGTWGILGVCMLGVQKQDVGYSLAVSPWTYALTESKAVLIYLVRPIWPDPLVFDYGARFLPTLGAAAPYLLGVIVLVAVIVAIGCWFPRIGYLGVWFLVLLAPTSSFVPVAQQPIAENRAYLPSAVVVAVLVIGLQWLLSKRLLFPVLLLAGAFLVLTRQRNGLYGDEIRLWRQTAAAAPDNPRAHYCLGLAYSNAGRVDEAIACYREAVRLKPGYVDARTNLGNALIGQGKPDEAMAQYEAALQFQPGNARVRNGMAIALAKTGRLGEALKHLEEAVRLQPDNPDWHYNLAVVSKAAGKRSQAIAECERVLALSPGSVNAQTLRQKLLETPAGKSAP